MIKERGCVKIRILFYFCFVDIFIFYCRVILNEVKNLNT